jgi:hypothetical protein
MWIKKLLYILSWLPVGALNVVMLLIGIPVVAYFARWPMRRWPSWTWIWQNDGDAKDVSLGAAGGDHDIPRWYLKKHGPAGDGWSAYKLRFCYMALRNPVNNHRYIFEDVDTWRTWGAPMAFDTEASHLDKLGLKNASGWRYSGLIAGYKFIWISGPGKYSEFYIGWKVGSRVPGLGFTFQLRLKRDFGT